VIDVRNRLPERKPSGIVPGARGPSSHLYTAVAKDVS
jgi:hypothetical protein